MRALLLSSLGACLLISHTFTASSGHQNVLAETQTSPNLVWLRDRCAVPPARAAGSGGLTDKVGQKLVNDYVQLCKDYQILPSADALTALELGQSRLRLRASENRPFGDLEFWALGTYLLADSGLRLAGVRSLDLSQASLGLAGMLVLAELLRHPLSCITELDISYQSVYAEGMSVLAGGIEASQTLRELRAYGCKLSNQGAKVLLNLIHDGRAPLLKTIDISNNYIPSSACYELRDVAAQKNIRINLNGNQVFDEVLNSVSHLIGEILAVAASIVLCREIQDKPAYCRLPVMKYCIALTLLYLCSTLNHAFFALGEVTVHVFGVLDYSGIYLLIAGSYSPFLGILFHGERWAELLQHVMWGTACLGILTAALYSGPYAVHLRLTLYLIMGWAAVCALPKFGKLGKDGLKCLVGGGILYTMGVPWFIRDRHTLSVPDHTIWHVFVIMGSSAHFFCIYWYVVQCQPVVSRFVDADSGTELRQAIPLGNTA